MTPLISFPSTDSNSKLLIKREDLSVTGSHKCRYLASSMKKLSDEKIKQVVLSTTGNAGITASYFAKQVGIQVWCLMSNRGDMSKAAEIERLGGKVLISTRPVRFARYLAKKLGCPLLKASEDEEAAEHYKSLGEELIEQVPDAEAILNFATSGTSSVGLMRAYEEHGMKPPALHIVQAKGSYSIAQELHPELVPAAAEDAYGLADTPRREELIDLIRRSGGDAWYVTDEEIAEAEKLLHEKNLETSYEGAACFWIAQHLKSRYQSLVIIFSGRKWKHNSPYEGTFIDSVADIDRLVSDQYS